jgi:hypothetical protein
VAPPEAISGRRKWVLEQSDVWSFGVLVWEVYPRGFVPHGSMIQTDSEVAAHICGGGRLDKKAECPDALHQVMCAFWAQRPQDSPSFRTLAAWLQGIARGQDACTHLLPLKESAVRECLICMSEPRVAVARPCHHCSMCQAYSQRAECPALRAALRKPCRACGCLCGGLEGCTCNAFAQLSLQLCPAERRFDRSGHHQH